MSEEEKQAIEQLKSWREYIVNHRDNVNKANDIEFYLRTALNLIKKQQNENETLKQLLQGYLYEMYKFYKEKCKNLSDENTNLKILIERQKIDDKNK